MKRNLTKRAAAAAQNRINTDEDLVMQNRQKHPVDHVGGNEYEEGP